MPDLVSPMQPSAGSGQPPAGPDWVVELAWTGHRCIAYVEPGRIRLLSSGGVSVTAAYPEIAAPLDRRSPSRGMILDGTIVARGEEHAPRPNLLKKRSARFHPSEQHIRAVPVDFQVADLLWLDGHSAVDLPYRDRRSLLEGLGFDEAPVWTTSPLPVSELESMLRIADVKGVDALHARHLGSRYRPGGRSPLWVRVPVPRTRQVVVGGWTPTDPDHPDLIASLLLGVPDPAGALRYVGRVGVTGEQRGQVAALRKLRRDATPFGDGTRVPAEAAARAIWVAPRLVGFVEFTGFTADGRLRLPHWRGPVPTSDVDETRWAVAADPPAHRSSDRQAGPPAAGEPVAAVPAVAEPAEEAPSALETPAAGPTASGAPGAEARALEQHFVYNALNTIAALIRTDPGRARELLFGFADLSRAADQSGATTTLGRELDAVRGYLQLEQARFGARLRVELDVDAGMHGAAVEPMRVLAAVREAVQQHIEPRPQGGVLTVSTGLVGGRHAVTVVGGSGDPVVIVLPTAGASV
ncbi:MAG: bifunctional non-ous end joining protein LigD [Pseudonocardiales bacterium]|jgi:bifunctional non-homologous end joining protein LigD|nr:bifunctional non-ous end joining protein LigD [Pseudonocardiales bacterium]